VNLDKVDVDEFLRLLEVDVVSHSGVNAVFSCPFGHADNHPSARMNVYTTAWLCSSCGAKGNAAHFLARIRDMEYEEAVRWVCFQFGIGGHVEPAEFERVVRLNLSGDRVQPMTLVRPDESVVYDYMSAWECDNAGLRALIYMESRGFDRDTLNRWQIGFDPHSRRVAIPVRDVDGCLVGFKGRSIADEQEPRYRVLGDTYYSDYRPYGFHTYSKAAHVYALNYIPRDSTVLVVEGELNVVAVAQKTGHFAVGVAGVEFSERQRQLIVERCSEAVVFFDNDSSGVRGTARVAAALMPFMPVSSVWDAPADAADLSGDEIDALVERAAPVTRLHASGLLSVASPDRLQAQRR